MVLHGLLRLHLGAIAGVSAVCRLPSVSLIVSPSTVSISALSQVSLPLCLHRCISTSVSLSHFTVSTSISLSLLPLFLHSLFLLSQAGGDGSMLIIGPWNHGGTQHVRTFPGGASTMTDADQVHRTVIGFMQDTLGGRKFLTHARRIQYFVMQEEAWRETEQWPPTGVETQQYYLGLGGQYELCESPGDSSTASIQINKTDGKTAVPAPQGNTRWEAMLYPLDLINYNFSDCTYLTFTSPVLHQSVTIVGQPVVTLWLEPEHIDTPIVVYLMCCESSASKSHYITEGHFNMMHAQSDSADGDQRLVVSGAPFHSFDRAARVTETGVMNVQIPLMPTAFKVLEGQRVQLSIGVSDSRHFGSMQDKEGSEVHRHLVQLKQDVVEPCQLQLPVLPEITQNADHVEHV